MSESGRVVVHVAAPDMLGLGRLEEIAAADSRVDVLTCAYEDAWDFRVAKSDINASPEELHRMEPPPTPEQAHAFATADVLLTHDTPLDLPERAPRLRWVHAIGSGVGNLRYVPLGARGITLTNSRGVASDSVADFAMGRILMVWKRFPELAELQARHEWTATFGRELKGATIGIFGVGAIGGALARRAKAFGMRVLGVRRTFAAGMTMPDVDELMGPEGLETLLRESDVLVLAAPGTPETVGLLDANALAAMKKGALLCNVGRGSLLDEAALVDSLAAGHLEAAILDVFHEEPLPASSPLWDVPNVYLSPHCAVSLDRYFDNVLDLFLDNLERYLDGRPLRNVVDLGGI
jgi:phosphoglycerate dehydrogenase-like enzyme